MPDRIGNVDGWVIRRWILGEEHIIRCMKPGTRIWIGWRRFEKPFEAQQCLRSSVRFCWRRSKRRLRLCWPLVLVSLAVDLPSMGKRDGPAAAARCRFNSSCIADCMSPICTSTNRRRLHVHPQIMDHTIRRDDSLLHLGCLGFSRSIKCTSMTRLSTAITRRRLFTYTFHLHSMTEVLETISVNIRQYTAMAQDVHKRLCGLVNEGEAKSNADSRFANFR